MQVTEWGSVRVDLVGGTLDLEPINLILKNVVTLNVATGLKAKVSLEASTSSTIEIHSADYKKKYIFKSSELTEDNLYYNNTFKEMSFVLQILDLFHIKKNLKIELSSGAPAGSGLGGSSAMGVTLFKALMRYTGQTLDVEKAILQVKSIEGRILNRGVPGYQDYFPALLGGILSLKGLPGKIDYTQLYNEELAQFLEQHISLIYSGISRNSGINNWDVYKGFFDGDVKTRESLSQIATISYQTLKAIEEKNYSSLLELIGKEGELRKELAVGIVPLEVQQFSDDLRKNGHITGMKMCGAGGGGCFILVHQNGKQNEIEQALKETQFSKLEFIIDRPLE